MVNKFLEFYYSNEEYRTRNNKLLNENQKTYTGKDYGVIAQEIEEVMPELVITRENGYKAVNYEKIIPLLIESIKEQQNAIVAQQTEIKELRELINNILNK